MITTHYDEDFDRMFALRHGGGVRRYHTWPINGKQSVAEHSWGVAMTVLALDPDIDQRALAAALTHDIAEGFTGDIPAPVKWDNPELARALDLAEEKINSRLGINYSLVLSDYEIAVVKAADMLELMFFACEQRMQGNRMMDDIFQKGYNWMHANVPADVWTATNKARFWAKLLGLAYVVEAGGTCVTREDW